MQDTRPRPRAKDSILGIAPYVAGRSTSADGRHLVKLSSNENPLGCSDAARAAFEAAQSRLARYPDPTATALRRALAEKYDLDPDRILCGTGSDEIIHIAACTFAGPGDEAIHVNYGFVAYDIATRHAGATPVVAPDADYATDVDAILERVTPAARLVFVANPNNPTGTLMTREEVARLHSGLRGDVVLVLDHAYAEFLGEDDGGMELARTADNVIVTRTFSKIHGLAGQRIGWSYGPAELIHAMHRIRGTFNVTHAGQQAAIAALGDDDFARESAAHNAKWRAFLESEVAKLGNAGLRAVPSAGNFVLVLFEGALSAEQAYRGLEQRGYIARWRASPGLDHGLRISIGTEAEMLGLAEALRDIAGD